jgi:hypothetical protein
MGFVDCRAFMQAFIAAHNDDPPQGIDSLRARFPEAYEVLQWP